MPAEPFEQKAILEEIRSIRGLLENSEADPLVPSWAFLLFGGLMLAGGSLTFLELQFLRLPVWQAILLVGLPLSLVGTFFKWYIRSSQVKSRAVPFWSPLLIKLTVASLGMIGAIVAILLVFLHLGKPELCVGLFTLTEGLVILMLGINSRFGILFGGLAITASGIAQLLIPLPLAWQFLWMGIGTGVPLFLCAPMAEPKKKA